MQKKACKTNRRKIKEIPEVTGKNGRICVAFCKEKAAEQNRHIISRISGEKT
jgi:hypothetical protein